LPFGRCLALETSNTFTSLAGGDVAVFALRVRFFQRNGPRCRGGGLIGGLTSAGVPQDQAVAAVFIQRLFTAYLLPIWGRVTLAWMRRREYA
jgi:hypothetical protein